MKSLVKLLNLAALTGLFVGVMGSQADERMMVEEAKVNGTPVRLAFDTGADGPALFSAAVERLGLKVSPVRNLWGQKLYPATEKCTVSFWGFSSKERLAVLRLPPYLGDSLDGLVGWPAVWDKVLIFDTRSNTVRFVRDVPVEATHWTRLNLRFWDQTLVLKMPEHRKTGFILIDTGSESGLGLPPTRWQRWKEDHAGQPLTLHGFYMPALEGFFVSEQAWAADFALGSLALTDLVVEEADPLSRRHSARKYLATLGLAALERLDLIVDGKKDLAYVRPKTMPPRPYQHNRAGVVFLPADKKSDTLIARVVECSPAFEAGIRNGDTLLRVDEEDVANWRTATNKISSIWERPAGTKVALSLLRSNKVFETTVTLREILPPRKEAADGDKRRAWSLGGLDP